MSGYSRHKEKAVNHVRVPPYINEETEYSRRFEKLLTNEYEARWINHSEEKLIGSRDNGEIETQIHENPKIPSPMVVDVGGEYDQTACNCPLETFSPLEIVKLRWRRFRNFLGSCYPLFKDCEYYVRTDIPPGEDDVEDCQTERDHINRDGDGTDEEAHRKFDDRSLVELEEETTEEGVLRRETIVCFTPEFWVGFIQIVILSPLLAFTAFLFVQWVKSRKHYKRKSAQLKKAKRENRALLAECDRLEAYLLTAHMSPLVTGNWQVEVNEYFIRINESMEDSKRKIREMEEEKSVLVEVLYNLRRPEIEKAPSIDNQTQTEGDTAPLF